MSVLESIKPFEQSLAKCCSCGLCLAVCPSYAVHKVEPSSPRGRISLTLGLLRRRIEPEETVQAFVSCALCGRCQEICPVGLPLLPIFFAMRHVLYKWLPIDRKLNIFFRLMAKRPKLIDFIQPPLALAQAAFLRGKTSSYPKLPLQPLSEYVPSIKKVNSKRVVLFLGCLTRRFFPELGNTGIALLEKCGVEVLILPELGCCGRPLAVQGVEISIPVMRNLAALAQQDFQWLLTPCPGCLATIRELWPNIPGLTKKQHHDAKNLAAKSVDINSYLAANLTGRTKIPHEIAKNGIWWHNPCLMENMSAKAALKLMGLENASGTNLSEPQCCGASLACLGKDRLEKGDRRPIVRKELALFAHEQKLPLGAYFAKAVVRDALAGHASAIVTGCPGCMLALRKSLSHARKPLPVFHALELIGKGRL